MLAGGLGTRLRLVLANGPKVLAIGNGAPFLTQFLDQVAGTGRGAGLRTSGKPGAIQSFAEKFTLFHVSRI